MFTYTHLEGEFTVPEQSFYRVSLKLLVQDKDGKALLLRNDQGTWAVPGGGWDAGETVEECVRREIQEELGVDVKHFDPKPVAFWVGRSGRGTYNNLKILLSGTLASHDFITTDEAVEVGFFSTKEMEKLVFDDDEKGIIDACRSSSTKKK